MCISSNCCMELHRPHLIYVRLHFASSAMHIKPILSLVGVTARVSGTSGNGANKRWILKSQPQPTSFRSWDNFYSEC